MGNINVTSSDMRLPLKHHIEPRIKIDVYDEQTNHFIASATGGITGGTLNINGESDIRWTFNVNVIPNRDFDTRIKEGKMIWVDKYIKVYLGMFSPGRIRDTEINWYPVGKYYPTDTSISYDATNNQISINCSDPVANLNGTRNGQYGALNTIFPAYYDTKFYSDNVEYVDNVYSCSIADYTDHYTTGDIFCLKIPSDNLADCKVNINNEGALPIYQKLVGYGMSDGELKSGKEYLFQVLYNPRTNVKYFTMVGECEDENIISTSEGEVIFYLTHHRIRDAVITVLKQLVRLKEEEYFVDNIGEYKAMPGYPTYLEYREETPLWDTIPFDQEFGVGSPIWQIITTFRDLYPNYEAYYDKDGIFIMQMIPDATNDPITLYNDYMQQILISENTSINLAEVRNVNLVYGKSIETDWFADTTVTYSDFVYSATIDGYDEGYFNGDLVALRVPTTNEGACYININGYGDIPVWDDNFEEPISKSGLMEEGVIYVFKIKKKRENKEDITRAYLLGHWQAVGLCALVNGTTNEEMYTTFDGRQVPVYSEEYFMDVYNVEHVYLVKIPDSPFTCEKIGVRLNVHSGGEFENIDSDQDAIERSKWETYKSARLTDSIQLSTKLVPFVNDVNFKVQYQRHDDDAAREYLVTSISHDFYGGTTNWTLVRFYEFYIPEPYDDEDNYKWGVISQYSWAELGDTFTWEDLFEL